MALDVSKGAETILLVDDEELLVEATTAILEDLGYAVMPVTSGEAAVRAFEEKGHEIDLVLMDMVMPGLSGTALFDQIRSINPRARVLVFTGYELEQEAKDLLDRGCRGYVQKPFDVADLSRMIRNVLEAEA
jgi:CheY-like chemotaxis protein